MACLHFPCPAKGPTAFSVGTDLPRRVIRQVLSFSSCPAGPALATSPLLGLPWPPSRHGTCSSWQLGETWWKTPKGVTPSSHSRFQLLLSPGPGLHFQSVRASYPIFPQWLSHLLQQQMCHKLSGLNNRNGFLQSWRLGFQDEGVAVLIPSKGREGELFHACLLASGGLLALLGVLWLVEASPQSPPSPSHGGLPVCVSVPLL